MSNPQSNDPNRKAPMSDAQRELLRAEYVLPQKGQGWIAEGERVSVSNARAIEEVLDARTSAERSTQIAQAQLVARVETLTRKCARGVGRVRRALFPTVAGLVAALTIGVTLFPAALLRSRRRPRTYGTWAQLTLAPVGLELLRASLVGVRHRLTSRANAWFGAITGPKYSRRTLGSSPHTSGER
jgi:hypothetical protein